MCAESSPTDATLAQSHAKSDTSPIPPVNKNLRFSSFHIHDNLDPGIFKHSMQKANHLSLTAAAGKRQGSIMVYTFVQARWVQIRVFTFVQEYLEQDGCPLGFSLSKNDENLAQF
jgi:hypothetical protein